MACIAHDVFISGSRGSCRHRLLTCNAAVTSRVALLSAGRSAATRIPPSTLGITSAPSSRRGCAASADTGPSGTAASAPARRDGALVPMLSRASISADSRVRASAPAASPRRRPRSRRLRHRARRRAGVVIAFALRLYSGELRSPQQVADAAGYGLAIVVVCFACCSFAADWTPAERLRLYAIAVRFCRRAISGPISSMRARR